MNKTMSMTTQSGKQFQNLARDIRNRFLGQAQANECPASDFRVVLYSHDTMGMGHMRRNLLIASSIKARFPNASILTIAGAKEACSFAQTAGIDCLTLPSFQKRPDGTYGSRTLGISADEILNVRSQTVLAAVQNYRPDMLIVDKIPSGAGGELLPVLDWLTRHSACHCVLGLRDILDTAEKVIDDWQKSHSLEIIRRHFHSVWIYGDQNVYDAVKEYELPADIAKRVTFTGYLDTRSRINGARQHTDDDGESFVLCTVGGGQDGQILPLHFVEAMRATGRASTLLTGPHMPEAAKSLIRSRAATVPALRVLEFVNEGDALVKAATHVVSMGGYNTLSAILSYRKPALIVPRVTPRQEQEIRANRFADLGLVQTIHPDQLTSESIVRWLDDSDSTIRDCSPQLDMHGLQRITESIHAEFPTVTFCNQAGH